MGIAPRAERMPAPTSLNEVEYKKWVGELYARYNKLYWQDEVLLDCWNNEQKKRAEE